MDASSDYIKIELDDGTGVYVTAVPLPSRDPRTVAKTAAEAAALLSHGYSVDCFEAQLKAAVKNIGR